MSFFFFRSKEKRLFSFYTAGQSRTDVTASREAHMLRESTLLISTMFMAPSGYEWRQINGVVRHDNPKGYQPATGSCIGGKV